MQLHLIDGTYELFRAFYGAPAATAPDGREVGATRGLMRSLLGLLGAPEVTHLGCAFDHQIESFRNELFAGYKTGEGIEPALFAQFELAEQATRALGIVTWPMVELEADDALATAAARFAPEVQRVVICSADKDLAQCVRGERVVCFDRMRKSMLDEAGVRAKFGVSPASIPDWLALTGDSADGIPGIPGWGKKSASTLLAHYGHIDAIPSDAGTWEVHVRGAARLSEALETRREQAALYCTLATLRTDAPLDETLDDLAWRGADLDALTRFAEQLGDDAIVERAERAAAAQAGYGTRQRGAGRDPRGRG